MVLGGGWEIGAFSGPPRQRESVFWRFYFARVAFYTPFIGKKRTEHEEKSMKLEKLKVYKNSS